MPRPIVGLMPAAGRATRLGELLCSKEIFPIGFDSGPTGTPVPRPVCAPLLRGWAAAGIERALVILRSDKWDIPVRLGGGGEFGLDLAYLVVGDTRSAPETLDRARAWCRGHDVAIGFPDILLRPDAAWSRLAEFHRAGGHDLSLGCFPCDRPDKADMVDLEVGGKSDGRLRDLVIKDAACTYRWTWSITIWTPAVMDLLHELVSADLETPGDRELWVGDVVREAVRRGLDVRGLRFDDGSYRDVGTPEDLAAAVREGGIAGIGRIPE